MSAASLPERRAANAKVLVVDRAGRLSHWPRREVARLFDAGDLLAKATQAIDDIADLRRQAPLQPHRPGLIDDAKCNGPKPDIQSCVVRHPILPVRRSSQTSVSTTHQGA